MDDKDKLNIVKNMERVMGNKNMKSGEISYCENCGEPARNEVCKMCELMGIGKKG
jgi:recombinational DNA repair protein RecR